MGSSIFFSGNFETFFSSSFLKALLPPPLPVGLWPALTATPPCSLLHGLHGVNLSPPPPLLLTALADFRIQGRLLAFFPCRSQGESVGSFFQRPFLFLELAREILFSPFLFFLEGRPFFRRFFTFFIYHKRPFFFR